MRGELVDTDAVEIGELYAKSRSQFVEAVQARLECGRRLTEKKAEVKHGEWLPWLQANAGPLGFSDDSTAQRLMKAAKTNPALTQDLNESESLPESEAVELSRKMWGNSKKSHVANNSGNNEWYTPIYILDAAREALGSIDFDPASSKIANKTVQADEYLTLEDDGLTAQWHGRVWLNPPYSQPEISDFCAAAVAAYQAGNIDAACILTNNATETGWLQSLFSVASAICFLRGRVKYLNEQGEPANSPLQGQCVTYLGKEYKNFAKAFKELGVVWGRV